MFESVTHTTTRYWATGELKKLREESNLTMDQMATKMGVSRGYYCKIENGQISVNEETFQAIAEILREKSLSDD